jgi:hypothetical protein
MIRSLERNAQHHRQFGMDKDKDVPTIGELDPSVATQNRP